MAPNTLGVLKNLHDFPLLQVLRNLLMSTAHRMSPEANHNFYLSQSGLTHLPRVGHVLMCTDLCQSKLFLVDCDVPAKSFRL